MKDYRLTLVRQGTYPHREKPQYPQVFKQYLTDGVMWHIRGAFDALQMFDFYPVSSDRNRSQLHYAAEQLCISKIQGGTLYNTSLESYFDRL